ncbi:hypothetical protein BKN37_12735 [Mycobacterium talmoniae]|uniref:Uncharacterized protein n=1 Tax=Mycobacterium talmoniae TaxID=1858794 RepID=A0A1S1NJ83_9MYCO|nr:hypothetical protein BKN37_12735 [Mycobacterium talmoniae]
MNYEMTADEARQLALDLADAIEAHRTGEQPAKPGQLASQPKGHNPMDKSLKDYADHVHGDYRRAAACVAHFARGDGDGVFAVISDAGAHNRKIELILAILGLYQLVVPQITDDDVIARIQQLAAKWAADEDNENATN